MLSRATTSLVKKYIEKFSASPPISGYDPALLRIEIRKALKTSEPMIGADEVLENRGITGVNV